MANEPAMPWWDPNPSTPEVGPTESYGGGGGKGVLPFVTALLPSVLPSLGGLLGGGKGGGGTNVRQSTSVSQATNIAFNPSLVNIMGDGSAAPSTSGYATGSPASSAPVYGDTNPQTGYLPQSGYGSNVYSARPYGDVSAYGAPTTPVPVETGPSAGTMLLLAAAGIGVMMFAGG